MSAIRFTGPWSQSPEFFEDADLNDVLLACDAVPVDVEAEEAPEFPDVLAYRAVTRAVSDLPERLRLVIVSRFALGVTVRSLAARLGVSHQRVNQLIEIAIGKLKRHEALVEALRGKPLPGRVAPLVRPTLGRDRVRLINHLMERALGRAPRSAVERYTHSKARAEARARYQLTSPRNRDRYRRQRAEKQERVRQAIERHLFARTSEAA